MKDDKDLMDAIDSKLEKQNTLQNALYSELTGFLKNFVNKLEQQNELESKVYKALLDQVEANPETGEEGLSTGALLKLYELLLKDKSEKSLGLIKAISETTKTIKLTNENPLNNSGNKGGGQPFTAEEMQQAKKAVTLLETIEKLGISELSEEELKKVMKK